MLPTGFLQDLLTRVDIVDVVGRQVTLKKAGINHKGLCPFHGEKTPSFTVSPSRQTYHCFGCGAHGDAIRFITETTGAGFMDAVRELAGEVGITVPDTRSSPEDRARAAAEKARQVTLTDVLTKAEAHYRDALKASPRAIDYLKGRGLSGQIAARFGLGYAPEGWRTLASVFPRYDDPLLAESGLVIQSEAQAGEAEGRRYDRFRDRIMFPIRSVRGEVIGFGGRVLDRGEPKYLNSPETPVFHKGQELYGLYEARQAIRKAGYVLVVEGYMDVVALAQAGLPHAVATLGTACTADHLAKLFRFTEAVVFSFDGDAAGRKAAARALEAALPHATDTRSVRFLFLPPEHDPDSYTRELGPAAFEQAVAEAVPLSSQLIALAAQDCDLETPEGRARTIAQARPLVAALPEGLLREQVLQALAERAGMGADALRQHWQSLAAAEAQRQRRTGPGESWGAAPGAAPDGSGGEPPYGASDAGSGYGGGRPSADRPGGRRRGSGYSGAGSGRSGGGSGGRFGAGDPGYGRSGGRFGRRPTPQAATRLDRAAWLLVCHAPRWQGLPDSLHGWLCAQPAPHGPFFAALERVLLDHGPVTVPTLLAEIQAQAQAHPNPQSGADQPLGDWPEDAAPADALAGLAGLLQRIRGFHALDREPPESDLDAVLRQLELVEIDDELRALTQADNPAPIDAEQLRALYARKKQLAESAAEPSPDAPA